MNSFAVTLGIDVAKLKFDACLINRSGKLKHKVFFNNLSGFEQPYSVADGQRRSGRVPVCLEATGTYGEALAFSLHARRVSGQCSQSGSHHSLCRGLPVAHQNRHAWMPH